MIRPALDRPGQRLRDLWAKDIVIMPGAFNALTARAAWKQGAQAAYLSGGAITNSLLGAPDIGLLSLDEMAGVASRSCQAAPIPLVCDADTGFGEAWNVVRTVIEMERAGLAGIHLEDQVSPKRCGHLDGKQVISPGAMTEKIRAGVAAKKDPSFVLIARTDARGIEGLDGAIARANAYREAGADAIFPEGLLSQDEFARFRESVSGPLLANMTEFGKTPLISAQTFGDLGYQMVIFPVTALRVMLKYVEELYSDLLTEGTQANWMDRMRSRADLYRTIDYAAYSEADITWAGEGP
jgi:methylisocitrate lyase